jgi:DnaA family protein
VSSKQLALPVRLRDDETFESFHARGNDEIVSRLEELAAGAMGGSVWLWGGHGCGKSHLLQACCHRAQALRRRTIYLPLAELRLVPDAFEGLGFHELVCIDDIRRVAGSVDLERAFVPLFNELTARGAGLVMAASTAPGEVTFGLDDVASRAASATVYRIASMDDAARVEILRRRASLRGLTLGDDVAEFILARASRDMRALMSTLDRLDVAALHEKRRLTIPFVKQVLGF